MLGLEVQALQAASLISANPLKVDRSRAGERQPRPQSRPRTEEDPEVESLACRALHRRSRCRRPSFALSSLWSNIEADLNSKRSRVSPDKRSAGVRHGKHTGIHPDTRWNYSHRQICPHCSPAVAAPSQRLRTLSINLQTCHQPP